MPKKIIVRAPQWLGDAVVSTIFLSQLKKIYPDAHIAVLCQPYLRDIFKFHSAVNEVLELPYHARGNVFKVGRLLKGQGFDTIYVLPRSARSALEAWLGNIPTRIGFAGNFRNTLLTQTVPYNPHQLYPKRYLSLLGEENNNLEGHHTFFPSEKPSGDLLKTFENAKKPILGISPKSVAPARTWDAERFAQVANEFIRQTSGSVVLFGIDSEKNVTELVKSHIKGAVIDLTGQLNFPEQTKAAGWAFQQCDVFLANDSGYMHVAAALDIPTVVLFGASDPAVALPHTGKMKAIQHKEIFCVPCLKNHCVRFGEGRNECLKKITVDEVLKSILGVLN